MRDMHANKANAKTTIDFDFLKHYKFLYLVYSAYLVLQK